jgi:hypothetical protein
MSTNKRLRALALAASRPDTPREFFTAPPERWNHGQDESKLVMRRMATRVCSGVDLLRRSREIGDAEEIAAERFYVDYVSGILGVRETESIGDSGSADFHTAQLAQCAAVTRHRAVAELIGAGMTMWMVAFIVDDLSFTAMADRFMPGRADGRRDMRARLLTLLMLLPGLYAGIDRKRS